MRVRSEWAEFTLFRSAVGGFKTPMHYQALSYDDETRHTVVMGADRLFIVGQRMLDSYHTQDTVRW